MKCREKREIENAVPSFTATGTPCTFGECPTCGTKMFRMGRIPEHDGLTPPENTGKRRSKKVEKRSGNLVIVESPAKARTVGRFLGKGYTVVASVGHVRDLLRSQISVDVENDFTPKYRVPNEKKDVVKELKKEVNKAETVYLATDPDREGEAIAWHLLEAADIEEERVKRVVFHEITESAVDESFAHPRDINMDLVNAQQARRVLDRLVGYSISPILWRKVRNRLSAGRVQSVALRMIVEREREIDAFIPEEYWTIEAELQPEGKAEKYKAKLFKVDDESPELSNEETTLKVVEGMKDSQYIVTRIKRGSRKRKAPAPFTTSTLQQEASRKLGFTAKRTMALAQQLYEGIDTGNGETVGLITYMRTDSVNVSEIAQKEAREYIIRVHGEEFVPEKIPQHKTKSKGAQEAHEAIRPTSTLRTPTKIKDHLNREQYRLYSLIWKRFVASQMKAALYDTLSVDIEGTGGPHIYRLRTSGSAIHFPGYLVVYEETKNGSDENGNGENGDYAAIPTCLEEGQNQSLLGVFPEQHFTQPPPRFSEATLVRELEENGIGRPSTYAPTLSTIQQRGYIFREDKRLFPTETGIVVNDLLVEHFPNIVDTQFTAQMESDLDRIAEGEEEWKGIIREFYAPFSQQVAEAESKMPEVKAEPEKVGRPCPDCGKDLILRWGRYGKFIGCSNFPECRYTEPWLELVGVKCPQCENGEIVERRTRKGRVFYGCSNYPECEFNSWKRPIATPCPSCQGTLIIVNKNSAQCLGCEERFPLDMVLPESDEEES
ncbi:MAG: type I DNA topoisomerase [Anaerolineales bacterium]|nr:type I DNA topoisomerase [Anaerolineales bacterium]